MQRLKVLFITKNFAGHVEKSSDYLSRELAKQADLRLWHDHGHIINILAQLQWKPDFILLNDFKPDYCPFVRGFRHIDIPVGMIVHDLQYKPASRQRFIQKEKIQYLFTIYRDPFIKWYPELSDRMIWFPHHVPEDVFRDYRLPKTTNWLMMGYIDERIYPLRTKMLNTLMRTPGFVYHTHPGYRTVRRRENGVMVGADYAKEINRAKMFLTCDSIYEFPVLKYYEALACNTLLLASGSKELEDLGFIDGETFVAVNETNFKEKAEYYLKNEAERLAVAQRGYQMVHSRHTTKQRISEWLEKIKEITKFPR